MNELDKTRGNRARRDKYSILADTKNLLVALYPAIQNMAKIERIEGSPVEIKRACREIIRHFSIAKECPEVRDEHIRQMIGEYGILQSNFEICNNQGLFTKGKRLEIANQLNNIKEGVMKWRNATRTKRQAQAEVIPPSGGIELLGSTELL